jgi:hypothetical protein
VTRLKWKLDSIRLEKVVILTQNRCAVCAKYTIGSEIILHTPDGLLGDEAQVEVQLSSFGDSANLDRR